MRQHALASLALAITLALGYSPLHAADTDSKDTPKAQADKKDPDKADKTASDELPVPPERAVTIKHSVRINGRTID